MQITINKKVLWSAGMIVVAIVAIVLGTARVAGLQHQIQDKEAIIQKKDSDMGALLDKLNTTEEGRKMAEDAKKASDATAASAKADANTTHAQLNTVNAQLNSANIDLAQAKRCVAKFNTAIPVIAQYQAANVLQNDYFNTAEKYYNSDYSTYSYYVDLSNAQTTKANNAWAQVSSIMNAVVNGNCY